ncbi:translocation/assembly module TamB domain-containing protein [Piscinibacter sp. HJYY11]|uniref:translocation/assembly module TamB domain-containing protein n=1 Tax=Piscinibacter sp. HJYY11 TaxID=2801333 RepID=UPI00191FAE14|nr:translocation/assembly module TamB domain-containing protein [Piscinibacter sp. HJYY11]MBL0727208.1 translocation/assembly module TamB domain-containing protein [Piscinibacter sp. HJYY11]
MADTAPAPAPVRRSGRRWAVIALATLGVVVLVLVLAAAAGVAWLRTDSGLDWALRQVPGLQITGMRGRPDGGSFSAQRLQWQSPTLTVDVEQLSWRDLQWRWRPYSGAWLGITLVEPRAQRVTVQTRPGPEPTAQKQGAPDHVRLPLEFAVRGLQVATVQVNTLPPIEALAADLHLGDEAGAVHRVQRLSARMQQRQADAQLTLRTTGDMALRGNVTVASLPGASQALQARVDLAGSLPRPQLRANLSAGASAQAQAEATLAPFEAWPIAALQASTRDLDLSTLAAGLPGTRLTGNAVVQGDGRGQPLAVRLDLSNALPGPWSALRLPVRELHALVQGDLAALSRLDFKTLDLQLHGSRPAGRVQGSGRWQDTTLALDLAFADVQLAQLHEAMAPATLTGPLQLKLEGVPSPVGDKPATPANGITATLHTDLRGALRRQGSQQPVQLALDGGLALPADGSLHARELRATLAAGGAQAKLDADVKREAQGSWQGRSTGRLTRFDPTDWWAGPADARGWRRGPHVLNGDWVASFSMPAAAAPSAASAPAGAASSPPALRDRLLAMQADATVKLRDSRLAGVPLQADLALKSADRNARLNADLQAAGARAKADVALAADPRADRGQVDIDAPALAALTPLFELIPGAAAWAPRSGSLRADASATGAWPALRTEGRVAAAQIDGGSWRLGSADARWTAAPSNPDAPLQLSLQAAALARGEQRLDRVQAEVDGSMRSHRMSLLATSPLRPPAWTDAALSQGQAPPRGGMLSMRGAGRWQPANAGGGEWRAEIAELRAAPPHEGATPWVQAKGVQAALRFAPAGGLAQATLSPNAVELLGATLRWQQASYEAPATAGAPPKLEVDAQLEPLAIAPWLARLQPHMGWGGDLRVGGRLKATSAQGFSADVVLERQGGDLRLSDAAGPRALGLSELRVAAVARNGVWTLRESVRGGGLGELSGTQTLRTAPDAVLPGADAAMEGGLNLRVVDLGAWSAWLPAGWRIGGRLQADASLSGRVGAPEYRGRVTGSGLQVANLLQGVQLTEGELALALDGERATLERLVFRGGDGTVRVEGGAQFGASPQAQLQLKAERLLALGRVDRRVVVSGDANLRFREQALDLDGRFTVDQGRIDISQADAPSLDEDVTVVQVNATGPAVAKDDASPGALARANVQLAVDLGQDLRLRGRGIDTLLKGRLRITTPEGVLAVNGTLRTDEGTYTAYGQNLAIERGVITFSGDLATPRLDILAVRPDIDVRVGVAVQGSAADPRIRLYSEPEMSEMDKISWIVMGREPEGMGRAETALLQRAALALLAGEGGNPSGGTLKKLGIDELSVARGDSGELRETVVTVGKQLSKRWFVAYERGFNAAAGSWQLIYRAARRFTVRAQSGEESAVDVIWTWRWN